jgi:TetR/AcrR family transcriptional regulator, cholesterol catabolism regulator
VTARTSDTTATTDRRGELLGIAARLFARQGLRETTVRDIADAAGILSGSLYHHFDSKESMVDEILRGFLDDLFSRYRAILDQHLQPRAGLEAMVLVSFEAIEQRHDAVAIYQNEALRLSGQPRFGYILERWAEFRTMWHDVLRAGMATGSFRADLDVDLTYRFLRDTVWVGVRWFRPGGPVDVHAVAAQYLSILLDGIGTGHDISPSG